MPDTHVEKLRLTDFVELKTLQEIQDSFTSVANVKATITDADGNVLTQPDLSGEFLKRQQTLAAAAEENAGPTKEGREYVAPIIVAGQRLGTIRMRTTRTAAVQFLFLLANAIARLCYQEFQLRQRIDELTTVYNLTMMLADQRDLQGVLNRAVRLVSDLMGTKAASIRLVDEERDELVIKAVHNLSREYLDKGPVRLSKADIDLIALGERGYEYVKELATDPRVQYPEESKREGVVSMLSAGLRYKGKAVGVLRVYTEKEQTFTQLQIDLLKAVAAQSAAAIENTRLMAESIESEQLEKQVELAAEVQRRMIPSTPPQVPGLELSAVYVPAYTLGGDFYDFITLPDNNLGVVIADVSGKGVPASLIMASVRAALRAQVDNVYYLYEVMRRVNIMLCRDTQASEFVTLFYGVYDARNKRLTYCNAGHPPPFILRNGKIIELGSDNMVLGLNPDEPYQQSILDLKSGDQLLIYTDGVTEAMNYQKEAYGKTRLIDAMRQSGPTAELLSQQVLWELRKFVGISKRSDDVTMIAAHVA